MNKTFKSIWSIAKQAYVAAAETVTARGKSCSGSKAVVATMALLGGMPQGAWAQTVPPPSTLPTGGQVRAGQASISQNGANMVIQQGSERASINWQSFNVGSQAQVQFQQPSAASVTLNRVMSSDPSQIFGRITANGQVILTNPQGVYFGPSARVDVGGLIATTKSISDADFMAGKSRYERAGSTASVINEGELKAALGGYIALLAPEVRNQGAIIAQMGTVALASGEAVDLHFDTNNRLTSVRVEPSQIRALVDNRHAIQAPGGLIILSAQSMSSLLGGLVKNSGAIEAVGLQQQGGRIVLTASHKIENTGSLRTNASANADGSANSTAQGPAGRIEISAPEVINTGSLSAAGSAQHSAGSVQVQAMNFTQSTSGSIDLSASSQGGQLTIQATGQVQLQGSLSVQATQDSHTAGVATQGGQIEVMAGGDIILNNAVLDASGGQGGRIQLRAGAPAELSNPNTLPQTPDAPDQPGHGRLAVLGQSTFTTRGRSGKGGGQTLQGEHIALMDNTTLNAQGAMGGGYVLVGGDWQGGADAERRVFTDPNALHQATTVSMASGGNIDASATQKGEGGTVVLWSEKTTDFAGRIIAQGAGLQGAGGKAEVSGKTQLNYAGQTILLGSQGGSTGNLLLDPYNLYITNDTGGDVTASANNSILGITTLTNALATANVTVSTGANGTQTGTIGVMTDITAPSNNLTLTAAGNVVIAGNVSMGGQFTVNAGGNFVMATNLTTAAGVTIAANGGFVKTGTGTSFLTGNITTVGTAIDIAGPVQIANFNGGANPLTLSTGGGNISLGGALSNYSGTAQNYAVLMASNLYDGVTASTVAGSTTDMFLRYGLGSNLFLSQLGLPSSVTYLLVGGGGGSGGGQDGQFAGGGGGGGGANGASLALNASSSYGITVGAGGTNGNGTNSRGISGGDSGFGTAFVGGGGGGGASGNPSSSFSGGLIGYGNNNPSTGGRTYQAGGGGGGGGGNTGIAGAGGTGGARNGSAGQNGGSQTNLGGNGGGATGLPTGYSSSITGTSVEYGVGGGGASLNPGAGGYKANYANGTTSTDGTAIIRYTVGSATTSAASALRLNAGNGSVTLGSTVASLSSLEVNAGAASSIAGAMSGTGSTLTNSGAGVLTLNGAATYTGATAVTSSGIVFNNNATPTTSGFTGAGTVTIQPTTSFTSAYMSGYSFASTLTGLTIGKTGNTQGITLGSAISIAGPIGVYGGAIALNANLTSTGANAGITAKATGNITQAANVVVTTNGGNVTYWADSDADGTGGINVRNNAQIDTRTAADRTASNFAGSGGGRITLAGGADDGSNGGAASDGLPDGFAGNYDNTVGYRASVLLGNAAAAAQDTNIGIYSGGGNIAVRGRTTTANAGYGAIAVQAFQGYTIDAGQTGNITMVGISSAAGPDSVAFDLATYRTAGNNNAPSLIRTRAGNISINGTASGGTSANLAVSLDGDDSDRVALVATEGGSITITGSGTGGADLTLAMRMSATDLLANSGPINLIGSAGGIRLASNGINFGQKASSPVISSSSAVLLRANALEVQSTSSVATSGTLTVEPTADNFTGTLSWPSNLTLGGSVSGLTLGKSSVSSARTDTISLNSTLSIAGPVNVYGGTLNVNAALSTTNTTTGDVTLNVGSLAGTSGITVANGRALSVTQSGNSTYSGVIAGTGSTFTKLGAGTLTLSGTSTYTGATTISAGVIKLGAAGVGLNTPLGTTAAGTTIASGAALDLAGFSLATAEPITLSGAGLSSSGAIYNSTSTAAAYSGPITLGADSSIKGGAGALTLSGTLNGGYSLDIASTNASFTHSGTVGGTTLLTSYTVNTGSGSVTLYQLSVAGPVSVYGGDITLNNILTKSGVSDANLLLKAQGNITLTTTAQINSSSGAFNTILRAPGTVTISDSSSISTSGGHVWIGGGSGNATWNGLTVGDGNAAQFKGLRSGQTGFSINSGVGRISISADAIDLEGSLTSTATSGTGISLNAKRIRQGYEAHAGAFTVQTSGADIIYTVTDSPQTANADYALYVRPGGNTINANGGNVTLSSAFTSSGVAGTGNDMAIFISGNVVVGTSGSGSITLNADASNLINTGVAYGLYFGGDASAISSASGAININVTRRTSASSTGLYHTFNQNSILSASGPITITDHTAAVLGSGTQYSIESRATTEKLNLGALSGSQVPSSTSDITVRADHNLRTAAALIYNTSGNVVYESRVDEFLGNTLAIPTFSGTPASVRLGKSTNTKYLTLSSAITASGPVTINGGAITLNAALTATNSTITLKGTSGSAVTDGTSGYVVGSNLLLLGGNVTLDHASNSISTLAASGVGSLTYADSNALTIGTVGATSGIGASGNISVSTLTGDLTLGADVSTTNSGASAVVLLNAGKSAGAGSAAGGNLVVSGSPALSVGTGGRISLMTGSLTGSTGLTSLSGLTAGTGRFRYNADEVTNFASGTWTNLSSGVYGVYRELPTAITLDNRNEVITYGDNFALSTTPTGLLNGDTFSQTITSAVYSSGRLNANATPYTITSNLTGLGYSVSANTLTVNRKALSISGLTAASKVYNADTTASVSGTAVLQAAVASGTSSDGKRYTGDAVSLTGAAVGNFNTKDVITANTVAFTGLSLTGAQAGNYSLTQHANATTPRITAKALTVSGLSSANKAYDGTTSASVIGTAALQAAIAAGAGISSDGKAYAIDAVSLAGTALGNFNTKDVLTANAVAFSGLSLTGTDVANYTLTPHASASHSITTKALSISAPSIASKIYNGGTAAGALTVGTLSGLVPGENLTVSGSATALSSANASSYTTSVSYTLGNGTGGLASNYSLANSTGVAATIGRATLTVRANDDAKFVTQADAANFAGVSYSGFVNGETASMLSGSATVTRTNAATSSPGTYTGVLQAGGLTPGNYQFNYVNGDFTVVGSNQMLVRVGTASTTYGTAATYSVTSAAYYNGSNVVTLGSGTGSVTALGSNQFTVSDGAVGTPGTATFTVMPSGSQINSTSGQLKVGSYQLQASNVTTANASNFSNNLVMVGSHSVATKALTASVASAPTKVYDGTTNASDVALDLAGKVTSDIVTASGVGNYATRNAGTGNLNYVVDNLNLSGADASNYRIAAGTSLSGSDGTITPKLVTLSPTATKVYDGQTTYTASASDLSGLSAALGVAGDTVSAITLAFDNKNAGNSKSLTPSAAVVSDGNNGGNYTLSYASNPQSSITRLSSVTWVGGASGNWFDSANWAGGAVPDLSNVANVVIPSGVTVSFGSTVVAPAQSGAVNIDSLTGAGGNLSQSAGTLNVGTGGILLASLAQSGGTLANAGSTTLDSFNQSGGSFSGTGNMTAASFVQTGGSTTLGGNLTVSQDFSQGTTGSVAVAGNTSITDTTGGVQLGSLTSAGALSVTSNDGAITQAAGTAITAQSTSSFTATQGGQPAAITLSNASNDFVGAASLNGRNVTIVDANALTLGDLAATGNLNATAAGDLAVNGVVNANTLDLTATTGNITQSAGSTITVATGPSNFSASGTVSLGGTNSFTGTVNGLGNGGVAGGGGGGGGGGGSGNDDAAVELVGRVIAAAVPGNFSPSAMLSSASAPPALTLPSAASSASPSQAQAAGNSANSEGVTVDLRNAAMQNGPIMAAVSLPKGSSTTGTGFSFELPSNIRDMVQTPDNVQATLPNGAPLPAWLKFDAKALRFEAAAVPDGAFPLQVVMQLGDQRVLVVISERTE